MATDIARREELRADSLAFHLPLIMVDPGCRQGLRRVYRTFLFSPLLGKDPALSIRLIAGGSGFPLTPGSTFLSGLWKRSWDEAVILTMMRILTDGPYFRACGRSWVPSETEELRALHSPDS